MVEGEGKESKKPGWIGEGARNDVFPLREGVTERLGWSMVYAFGLMVLSTIESVDRVVWSRWMTGRGGMWLRVRAYPGFRCVGEELRWDGSRWDFDLE